MKRRLSRFLAVLVAVTITLSCLPLQTVYASSASNSKYPTLQEAVDNYLQSFDQFDADEQVEFIVELEGKPLVETKTQDVSLESFLSTAKGEAAVSTIKKEQASVKEQLLKNKDAMKIEFEYRVVLNGFAVKAKYSEKERLESIPGVKNVYVAEIYDYIEPKDGYTRATQTSGKVIDSDRANAEGYTGKNVVTAVLDTGLDVNHSAFANVPESVRYDLQDVEAAVESGVLKVGQAAASDLYISEKIPFAYDYADKDTDVSDSVGHGTHVSGTVGADSDAFTGVAPDAQIMMMKVFSDAQSGASQAWVIAALEDCVVLGVDTINMSLGSGAGFSRETDTVTNQVYQRVEAEGINLLCAAGNDTRAAYKNLLGTDMNLITDPDNGVAGSASTYFEALSVASINEESAFTIYFKAGDNKITFADPNTDDALRFEKALDGQTLEYVPVPGFGDAYDFAEVDVEGKIALVERGTLAFTEKEQNAKDAGAVGLIVYDNEVGELTNMQLNGLLPAVFISKADGRILRNLEDKKISVSVDFAEFLEDPLGGQMSSFSSLGVAPDLTLKPEITAPGGNVYSTLPGGGFGSMSGTSMASPHMAGAAAVMKQYVNEKFPSMSATDKQQLINYLMMSTAVPVVDPDGVAYTPRKQGAGLAQVYSAIHTGAYLTVENSDRTKAELKDNVNGTFSFTFTIHNMSGSPLSYDLSAIPLTAKAETVNGYRCISDSSRVLPESEFTVGFSQNSVTVPANGSVDITVNMQLTDEGKAKLAEFTNGTFLDGFIKLESKNDDEIDLSMPYLGFYGDWAKAPIFDNTIYDDEDPSTYDMSGVYLIDYDWTGYPIGVNMLSGDFDGASADKIAIASRTLGYKLVHPVLGMLRGSKETNHVVTNSDGEEVYAYKEYESRKSYYNPNIDAFSQYLPAMGWAPIYEDGGFFEYLPDGEYTYSVTGRIDGTEGTQSISFPIVIDNEAPQILSHQYVEEDGTPYLVVTMRDNHYIMGLQLVNDKGNPLTNVIAEESSEAGSELVYKFDLTEAQAAGEKLGQVMVMDFAQNITESAMFSLTGQEIEPLSVRINQQHIALTMRVDPFQLTATVYPETAVDKSVTWTSEDESVATVTEDGLLTTVGDGKTIIRATAWNGVYGTTEVTVIEPTEELPADYVIRKDGRYEIPADLNRNIVITDDAHNVKLVGDPANTADNPYRDLTFTSENENLNLTVSGLNVLVSGGKSVIQFKGAGNTLALTGVNTFASADNSYYSKALVNVPEDSELTIKGGGTLNITQVSNTYGAGIGGNAGQIAGTITINGGTINGVSYDGGAIIGGGSNAGVKKVTVNGGVLNLELPYYTGRSAYGAGIGSGDTASKGATSIEINGGEINGETQGNSALIGSGYATTVRPNIVINGGKLNLRSSASEIGQLAGGACIGSGAHRTGGDQAVSARITINGGEIIATTNTDAAAIGGGAGVDGAMVYVNGGTVTASTSDDGAAIGGGIYPPTSGGELRISAGTVKATATGSGPAIGDSSVDNSDSDRVFEVTLLAPNVKSVSVNGIDWKVSANHPDDENLHLWLAEGTHNVAVETDEGVKRYEVVITAAGNVTATQYFDVTYALSDLTTDASATVYAGETLSGTLSAADGKHLPGSIKVTMGGADAEHTYDAQTGAFSVPNVSGDIVITAAAVEVSVDKSALEAVIAEAEALNEEDYTSGTWTTLSVTLGIANAVYANPDANQNDVDEAADALRAAIDGLIERGDKAELNALITEAEALNAEDYTIGTWATFETALEAAREVAADADAVQAQIDEAKAALETAMDNLIRRGDKDALSDLIAEAEALNEADYTTGTWNTLETALEAAKTVIANENATQQDIDDAADALRDAIDGLIKRGDKTELNSLIEEAEALDEADYTIGTWAALIEALEAAKDVASDVDATQAEVDEAKAALEAAMDNLIKRGDKDALSDLIAEAEALNEADYTTGTWNRLKTALEAARLVVANENASQTEIDEAADALRAAIDGLALRGNKAELNALISEAEALEEEDYTAGSWAQFITALEDAKDVSADVDATQAEVDGAKATLKNAMHNLIKRGDKDALSNLIAEAEALNEADYTTNTWAALVEALEAAKTVVANENASQQDIDDAADALKSAIDGLIERGDKAGLNSLIADAEALDEEDYTIGTWATFKAALDAAKDVAANIDATQPEIDEAKDALEIAMNNLIKRGDRSALSDLIDEAQALNEADYTSDTWQALKDALEAAKAVVEDEDASQQAIDDAADALRNAIDGLIARGDKTELNGLIAGAEALNEADYTAGSWAALISALDSAKAVAADADATQAHIDDAKAALEAAMDALTRRGDKSGLNELINKAESLNSRDYTAGTWSKLVSALDEAKKIAADADATQAQIDAAAAALSAALNGLQKNPFIPGTGGQTLIVVSIILLLAAAAVAVVIYRRRNTAR